MAFSLDLAFMPRQVTSSIIASFVTQSAKLFLLPLSEAKSWMTDFVVFNRLGAVREVGKVYPLFKGFLSVFISEESIISYLGVSY